MALDHLIDALGRQAGAETEALLAAARADSERIRADAAERMTRARGDAVEAVRAELRARLEADVGEARRGARGGVLEARQRLLDRVFAAAGALLPSAIATERYRAALPQHLAQALAAVAGESVIIRCPEELAETVRALTAGQAQMSVVADPGAGPGIRVTTQDGAIDVDNTLAGRLERERPRLALDALTALRNGA
jgi:vacuolar-type H+-ATPase subunit E/Vma4